jgi:hypothetical protein
MEFLLAGLLDVASLLRPSVLLNQNQPMLDALVAARRLTQRTLDIAAAASPPIALTSLATALSTAPSASAWSASIRDITALNAELMKTLATQPGIEQLLNDEPDLEAIVGLVEQELCMQLEMERNWTNLVHSLVANCSQIDVSLGHVQTAVNNAVLAVAGEACIKRAPLDLPPTLETSMDTLIERVDRLGVNRPNPALPGQVRF